MVTCIYLTPTGKLQLQLAFLIILHLYPCFSSFSLFKDDVNDKNNQRDRGDPDRLSKSFDLNLAQ
jgi:hypothetical protein